MVPSLTPRRSSGQNWRNPVFLSSPKNHHSNKINLSIKTRRPRRGGIIKKLLGILVPLIILLILLGGLTLVALLAWVSKDLPSPDGVINRSVAISTKIYDRTGKTVLYDIHGDIKRTLINVDDIKKYTIDATLAAEDRNFYQHRGFSITGIVRSVLLNLATGSKVGGSTLTQQFIKNAVLTNEKTYTRKIKELLLSYQLEKKFTKKQILQMYFNEIPYGSVVYGIEAASQTFFGKSAKDLTIAESAILAAIPQAPTLYSPSGSHRDLLIARQKYIIDSMVSLGYITKDQGDRALQEKIIFKPASDSIIAPHFVMYIKELLSEKYGDAFITQEGLRVYTSLDLDKQRMAEKSVQDGIDKNSKKYDFNNASLVAIDPTTGQVLAMVGSANYFDNNIDGQVNVALSPHRQPGSSFKPIVYAASFIKGYTPNTILYDVNTNFDTTGNSPYKPKNYDLKERGPVTIRQALAGSLNIPAVKATYLTGTENILNLADKMGYTTLKDRSRYGLSLVLGGGEVKLLDHVAAYTVFAQDGLKHALSLILKIEDRSGRVLYEYKDQTEQIMEPQIAREVVDILSDDQARSYVFGLGGKLTLPGRPAAAKTGTTNDYKDAWTMGFTPDLVTGVWVGNTTGKAMKSGADGSIVAAPIWNQFMQDALKDAPPKEFAKPDPIVTGKAVLDGELSQTKIKIDTMLGNLATQYTPESTIKELSIREDHDILYYINKDDPRGDSPSNPAADPQFSNWEEPVLKWAQNNNFIQTQKIPTEYDNIHWREDQPTLIVIQPLPNQTINYLDLTIEISGLARRGIRKAEYYINGILLTTKYDLSDTTINLSGYDSGYNTLTIKIKDDLENTASKSIDLNFLLPQTKPTLSWLSPKNNSTITFPANLTASLTNWEKVKKIDFYYTLEGNATENYLSSIEPKTAEASLSWKNKPTAPGNYKVYGNMFTQDGKKTSSESLRVVVE